MSLMSLVSCLLQVVKSIAEGRESACKRVRFLIAARLESLNALELR